MSRSTLFLLLGVLALSIVVCLGAVTYISGSRRDAFRERQMQEAASMAEHGDFDSARQAYRNLSMSYPDDDAIRSAVGELDAMQLAHCRKTLSDPEAHGGLHMFRDQALAYCTKRLKTHPDDSATKEALLSYHERQRDAAKASHDVRGQYAAWKAMMALDPTKKTQLQRAIDGILASPLQGLARGGGIESDYRLLGSVMAVQAEHYGKDLPPSELGRKRALEAVGRALHSGRALLDQYDGFLEVYAGQARPKRYGPRWRPIVTTRYPDVELAAVHRNKRIEAIVAMPTSAGVLDVASARQALTVLGGGAPRAADLNYAAVRTRLAKLSKSERAKVWTSIKERVCAPESKNCSKERDLRIERYTIEPQSRGMAKPAIPARGVVFWDGHLRMIYAGSLGNDDLRRLHVPSPRKARKADATSVTDTRRRNPPPGLMVVPLFVAPSRSIRRPYRAPSAGITRSSSSGPSHRSGSRSRSSFGSSRSRSGMRSGGFGSGK